MALRCAERNEADIAVGSFPKYGDPITDPKYENPSYRDDFGGSWI